MKGKRKQKLLRAGLGLILSALCLTCGCTRRSEPYRISLVVKSTKTEFWNLVYRGASAFASQHNIELEFCGPEEESQQEEQREIFEECAKKQDAIVLAAADYDLFEKPIEEADIPVVLIDGMVKGEAWNVFVGTDNYGAGRKLAGEFLERSGTEGKLAVISFVKNTGTAIERENGFLDEIRKNSDIQILETRYCQSSVEKSYEITKNLLENDPDIDKIVGMNAQSLMGAARAVSEEKFQDRDIFLGGLDCLLDEVDFIEEGIIDVCILQNPYMMGYYGMENALKALKKEKTEKYVWVETYLVDRNTVYEKKSQELIFPFY